MKKSSFTGTKTKVPGKHFLLMVKMFLFVLLTSTLFSAAQAAQQQKKQLSGTVADASGEPLIGAGIIEKGTTNGTLTNINGMFSLQVEDLKSR